MASGCHAFILLHNLANVRHTIVIHAEMFTSNGPFPTIVPKADSAAKGSKPCQWWTIVRKPAVFHAKRKI